jgi:hypothetical protein
MTVEELKKIFVKQEKDGESLMRNDLEKIISDLDGEIMRTKMFINANCYHHGTSVWAVVNRYRNELKALKSIIQDDLHIDGIKNYGDLEHDFNVALEKIDAV